MTVQGYIVVEVQKDRKGQNHLRHESKDMQFCIEFCSSQAASGVL